MLDDSRLDSKLAELSRELVSRPVVPGYTIADAFTMRGIDESGKPGVFAAILLAPQPPPELGTLTTFRSVLAQRLKQLDTAIPAWPIVVQGAPEELNGQAVVPGGRDYFEQLRGELKERLDRQARAATPVTVAAQAEKPTRTTKPRRVTKKQAVRRASVARSARTARTGRPSRAARRNRR